MKRSKGNWYCTINGRKYECIFGTQFVSFIDTTDSTRFFTIGTEFTMNQLLKNTFFWKYK